MIVTFRNNKVLKWNTVFMIDLFPHKLFPELLENSSSIPITINALSGDNHERITFPVATLFLVTKSLGIFFPPNSELMYHFKDL